MVRVGFPGGPRLEWYDRNPQMQAEAYNGTGIPPHGLTERWSYTVPTGKKCLLEMLQALIKRALAATTEDLAYIIVNYTKSGGVAKSLIFNPLRTNLVGDGDSVAIGATLTLLAGDVLAAKTGDASDGGWIDYNVAYKSTEFDA